VAARRLIAEFVGTGFLLAGVVGSGIMAERLSSDTGLQLLQNALATRQAPRITGPASAPPRSPAA
jgi:glycerol uptake facilitator-like aquaporin